MLKKGSLASCAGLIIFASGKRDRKDEKSTNANPNNTMKTNAISQKHNPSIPQPNKSLFVRGGK